MELCKRVTCHMFMYRGILNTYGEYQTYYQESLLSSHTESEISWIGSMQAFFLFFISVAAGPLYDLGFLRLLLSLGTLFIVLGMMLTSICKVYWQTFLAQGVLVGIGNGCLFICSVTIIGQYFTTRRAIATGIASLGSSIGVLSPNPVKQS